MRILYLNDDWPPEAVGGAGIVAFNLARGVAERGNEVRVVTTIRDKGGGGVFEEEGIKVYKIYANYHERWRAWLSLCNPQTVGRVKEIIREFKPDAYILIRWRVKFQNNFLCKKGH